MFDASLNDYIYSVIQYANIVYWNNKNFTKEQIELIIFKKYFKIINNLFYDRYKNSHFSKENSLNIDWSLKITNTWWIKWNITLHISKKDSSIENHIRKIKIEKSNWTEEKDEKYKRTYNKIEDFIKNNQDIFNNIKELEEKIWNCDIIKDDKLIIFRNEWKLYFFEKRK